MFKPAAYVFLLLLCCGPATVCARAPEVVQDLAQLWVHLFEGDRVREAQRAYDRSMGLHRHMTMAEGSAWDQAVPARRWDLKLETATSAPEAGYLDHRLAEALARRPRWLDERVAWTGFPTPVGMELARPAQPSTAFWRLAPLRLLEGDEIVP